MVIHGNQNFGTMTNLQISKQPPSLPKPVVLVKENSKAESTNYSSSIVKTMANTDIFSDKENIKLDENPTLKRNLSGHLHNPSMEFSLEGKHSRKLSCFKDQKSIEAEELEPIKKVVEEPEEPY